VVIVSDPANVATHIAEAERLRGGPSRPGVLLLQPRAAQALALPAKQSSPPVYWPVPVAALAEFVRAL
jgi:hypothetical protein